MIKFKVEGDLIRIVSHDVEYEKNLLLAFFKKKSKAAAFNVMVDRGLWDGFDKFVSKDDTIAIGLWKEIERFSKTNGVNIEIEGLSDRVKMDLPKENYLRWVENLLSGVIDERGGPIEARDYQIEGAFRALNYRFCTQELATSAGKTLIFYLYNCFLRDMKVVDKKTKSLIIVPNISLVNQTAEKFHLYSVGKKPWSICTIGGSSRFDQDKFDDCELVISTYQSLMNLPPEIFEAFSVVNVDETHKSAGSVIKRIIKDCFNWKYRLGLSGTVKVDEEFSDFFKFQENVGPLVMVLPAKHLMDHGYSPKIKVKILELRYDESSDTIQKYWALKKDGAKMYKTLKDFGKDMLSIEKGIIFDSEERLDFISDLVKKFGKNTLVLFSDIKNSYGKRIQSKLLEWNQDTFYVDGGVDSDDRDEYKAIMESKDGVVICASFGTFAVGLDLKRVHHIVFAESTKAEITIRQAIGRGMRKLAEKNSVCIWDLVDRLDGYMVKHAKKREKIYQDQEFEIAKKEIDLIDRA